MNLDPKGLLGAFEDYYGLEYREYTWAEILAHIESTYPRRALDLLRREVFRIHSGQYGKLPDIAVLEAAWRHVSGQLASFDMMSALPAPTLSEEEKASSDALAALHQMLDDLQTGRIRGAQLMDKDSEYRKALERRIIGNRDAAA